MTGSDNSVQVQRKARLEELVSVHHRRHYGDYEDTYNEFSLTYLGVDSDGNEPAEEDGAVEVQPIPQFAAIVGDETYGLISLHDTVLEAVDAVGRNIGGDTLNTPVGVFDMDTGNEIETVTVVLTRTTWQAMGGIVAMNEGEDVLDGGPATNKDGIFTDWEEIRRAFPLEQFKEWATKYEVESDGEGYDPEAGF